MWLFNNSELDETQLDGYIGFVYIITNLSTNRKYIGKKRLKFKRTKQVKGKKKKVLIDSDWRTYWGSNKTLIEEVKQFGPENYKREILRFCKSKGEMNYFELWYQITMGALESDDFYNDWASCKIHKTHLKNIDFSIQR